MFTVKFYDHSGLRQRILSAESFTLLRGVYPDDEEVVEVTLHQKDGKDDCRIDLKAVEPKQFDPNWPPIFARAIIENSAGKTTEFVYPGDNRFPPSRPAAA